MLAADSALLDRASSVNSTRFRLNYQVDTLAVTDLQEVAVWVTTDLGRSWRRLGTSPDPRGPYSVEVDGSGLYGFRLVVVAKSGIKSRIPQPGDDADKWVHVDVDPPQVHITSAPFGTDENAGKLVIHWNATDARLSLRPIELSYSSSPNGPWTTIERGIRNTGSYAWAADQALVSKVYLQIVARDEAGNVRGIKRRTRLIWPTCFRVAVSTASNRSNNYSTRSFFNFRISEVRSRGNGISKCNDSDVMG